MTQSSNSQENYNSNEEFINAATLRMLIMAGAFWAKKRLPIAVQENVYLGPARASSYMCVEYILRILESASYVVGRCPSDSVENVISATQQGSFREGLFEHRSRIFRSWLVGMVQGLRGKQKISALDFAHSLYLAKQSADPQILSLVHRFPSLTTIASALSRVAFVASKNTTDISKMLEKILIEIESFLEERLKWESTESLHDLEATGQFISISLGLRYFFEGIKLYIKNVIIIDDIQEYFNEIRQKKIEDIKKLEKDLLDSKNESTCVWCHRATKLLDTIILIEVNKIEIIELSYEVSPDNSRNIIGLSRKILAKIDPLIDSLKTINAPRSLQLAQEIRNKLQDQQD